MLVASGRNYLHYDCNKTFDNYSANDIGNCFITIVESRPQIINLQFPMAFPRQKLMDSGPGLVRLRFYSYHRLTLIFAVFNWARPLRCTIFKDIL